MRKLLATIAAVLALTTSASAQFEDQIDQLKSQARTFANRHIECVNYMAAHQCNSMDRCVATRDLLNQVANGSSSLAEVNEYTTNKNNCACVRAFMGHNYIKEILDTHGAQPHDERYKGCYGQ